MAAPLINFRWYWESQLHVPLFVTSHCLSMDWPGPKGVLSGTVRSLTKVRPLVHDVGVEMGFDVGTMVAVGTRIMIWEGMISMDWVGGIKNVGVGWAAHAVRMQTEKKNADLLKLKRCCVVEPKLKRLADNQRRAPFSGISALRDQLQLHVAARKHGRPVCAYLPCNWFPRLF